MICCPTNVYILYSLLFNIISSYDIYYIIYIVDHQIMNSNTDMSEVMARRHVEPRFQASSVGWIPGPEAG